MITQEQLPMVAIPSMNDTHLEESLIINKLDTAVHKNDIKSIRECLIELIEHTNVHFLNEENLMKEAGFSDYQTHKIEHDRHLNELNSLVKYFDKHQDPKAVSAYIEGSLTPWMIYHVNTMDSAMAQFVKEATL